MPYTPILATLGYVLSPDRQSVLLIHRTRPGDDSFGKYNGLGGKLEPREDAAAGMIREIREEASIEVTAMDLRGTISWPGFGKDCESWLAFVFLVTAFSGEPLPLTDEGSIEWQPVAALVEGRLPIWEGDRLWLHMVFDDDPRPFHGVAPYDGFEVLLNEWRCTRM